MDEVDQYLAVSRLAVTTKELYAHYLHLWKDWIDQNKIIEERARAIDLAGFCESRPAWSNSTRNSACCAVRAYYIWKYGRRHELLDFMFMREECAPQRTPDRDQLFKIMACLDTSKASGKRSLAMFTLMLDAGLRASEVCRLDLEHLNVDRGMLWVRVKRGKWKPKRFFDYTRSCMVSWLSIRSEFAKKTVNTVFVVLGGKTKGEPMKRRRLFDLFDDLGKRAEMSLSPHDLRRAFTTQALDNGASSRLVQEAGGWENIQMVERYSQALDLERMREFSPVDRLMGLPVTRPKGDKTIP